MSAFGFGAANVVAKKTLENLSPQQTLVVVLASGSTLLFMLMIATGNTENMLPIIPMALVMALLELASYLSLYKSFSIANLTVAVSILSTYPLFTFLIATGFLGENGDYYKLLSIVLIILGAILTSIDWQGVIRDGFDKRDLAKGLPWVLVTLGLYIVYFPLLSVFMDSGNWEPRLFLIKLFSLVFLIGGFILTSKSQITIPKGKIFSTSLLGVLEVVGWIGLGVAFASTTKQAGSIIALSSIAPLFTAIGAYIFLKERLKSRQYIGVIVTLLGVIGLSV